MDAMDAIVTQPPDTLNLSAALDAFLDPALLALVRRAAALADANAMSIYVVGGTVRDLLLKRPSGDLDLVVEGDAIALAGLLAAEINGNVTSHTAFGTAALELQNGTTLDFITARREVYAAPATLPRVQPADLRADLFRRDFTINTLAIQLNGAQYGQLFDLYSGIPDLARGLLRVLHDASFVDDPTRLLRAVRMAARLDFALEPHTRALFVDALAQQMIERTTPQRIANELRLVLHEPQPEHAIALLDELGALPHLHPALRWSDNHAALFRAARQADFPNVALHHLYIGIIVYALTDDERTAIIERYRPTATITRLITDVSLVQTRLAMLHSGDVSPSRIDQALHGIGEAALRAAQLVVAAPTAACIDVYLATLRATQIELNGRDLQRMGLQPGPLFREVLAGLRAEKLDGLLQTRADEEAWVQRRVFSASLP